MHYNNSAMSLYDEKHYNLIDLYLTVITVSSIRNYLTISLVSNFTENKSDLLSLQNLNVLFSV